jgi:transcriptional regulator with XRE-family HTH domain
MEQMVMEEPLMIADPGGTAFDRAAFAARLHAIRRLKGLSVFGLTKEVGLARPTMEKLVRGEVDQVRFGTLITLAHALGVPLQELLFGLQPQTAVDVLERIAGDALRNGH